MAGGVGGGTLLGIVDMKRHAVVCDDGKRRKGIRDAACLTSREERGINNAVIVKYIESIVCSLLE